MEYHSLDHNHQPIDLSHDALADFNTPPSFDDSSDFHNPLNDQPLADYQSLFDSHPINHFDSHSLGSNFSESQQLNSYHEFNSIDHSISLGQHPQSFDHNQFISDSHIQLDHNFQRSGSAEFTPSSPADITVNKEVIFKDKDGHEHSGTIKETHLDDTYKIQTSDQTYDNVAYHDIQKHGSK
jgi:hypothetical protein